jgi:hypothetical protein
MVCVTGLLLLLLLLLLLRAGSLGVAKQRALDARVAG